MVFCVRTTKTPPNNAIKTFLTSSNSDWETPNEVTYGYHDRQQILEMSTLRDSNNDDSMEFTAMPTPSRVVRNIPRIKEMEHRLRKLERDVSSLKKNYSICEKNYFICEKNVSSLKKEVSTHEEIISMLKETSKHQLIALSCIDKRNVKDRGDFDDVMRHLWALQNEEEDATYTENHNRQTTTKHII